MKNMPFAVTTYVLATWALHGSEEEPGFEEGSQEPCEFYDHEVSF